LNLAAAMFKMNVFSNNIMGNISCELWIPKIYHCIRNGISIAFGVSYNYFRFGGRVANK
jgi:hypothetical protein